MYSMSDRKLWGARIAPDAEAVLHVAMAFDECSAQELLQPVIEGFAKQLADQPEIQAALTAKREYRARKTGKLSRLKKDVS